MARCLVLLRFSVEDTDGECLVELEGSGIEPVEWFEGILSSAFPGSCFGRVSDPSDSGVLGLQKTLVISGNPPKGGVDEVEEFLSLMTGSLTIEDSLDESHALGYHQDEDDETGELTRSRLGLFVRDAKYYRDTAARQRITEALCKFIEGHPRYREADAVCAVPPHQVGDADSLCQRLVTQLAEELGLDQVEIRRVSTRPPQKDIVDEDRRVGVQKRIANQEGSMRVDVQVPAFRVVVLDDLYGSGGSMREAARTLRESGAKEVLGLTVTKQRLYEGVRLASHD